MDTGSRELRFTSVPGRPSLESPLERDLCKLGLRPRFISSPDNSPARLLCSTAMTDSSKSYNDAGAELEKKSIEDSSSEHGVGAMDALNSGASGAATAKLWTKLDLLVLPVVTMMYFLSSLVSLTITLQAPVLPWAAFKSHRTHHHCGAVPYHQDRSNIGNARIAGLQQELHMSDYQVLLRVSLAYLEYVRRH